MAKEELGQGEQQQMAKGALIKGAKQRWKEEKPNTATRAEGNDIIDKR